MTLRRRRPPPETQPDQIVYRGRSPAGAISQRGRRWLALDIDGRRLGWFPSRVEAFAQVLRRDDET